MLESAKGFASAAKAAFPASLSHTAEAVCITKQKRSRTAYASAEHRRNPYAATFQSKEKFFLAERKYA